jgi:large subunit ribosomal protein L3
MKFLLGRKLAMTQVFKADGTVVPVTLIEGGPVTITQVKTKDSDGYTAAQVGFGLKKKLSKPQTGHLKDLPAHRWLREVRLPNAEGLERGKIFDVTVFSPGDSVKVSGTSKGRGFAGVVKRHHFKGGPASRGHKDNLRAPGSIGATFPQHVMKGTRMAGRMGGERVSVRNLEVVEIRKEENLLVVRGGVPGPINGLVEVRG